MWFDAGLVLSVYHYYKLQVFILQLRVANYKTKPELQFSNKFAESNFATVSCWRFLHFQLLNSMLSKPLGVSENYIGTIK